MGQTERIKDRMMMTIEELASISGLKEKTVRQKILTVAGVTRAEDGALIIPDGSRYPYDIHRYKLNDTNKRRVALLDAIFRYRYIDHAMLCMSSESFKTMLAELLNVGLVQRNGSENPFGANGFDTTMKYEELRSDKRYKTAKAISDLMGSATGHFTGAVLSELLS